MTRWKCLSARAFYAPDKAPERRFEILTCALRGRLAGSRGVPDGPVQSHSVLVIVPLDGRIEIHWDTAGPSGTQLLGQSWDRVGTDQSVLMYRRSASPTTSEEVVVRRGTLVDDLPQVRERVVPAGHQLAPSRRPTPAPTESSGQKVPGSRPARPPERQRTTHSIATHFVLCPAAVGADPGSRLDRYLEFDAQGAIGLDGTSISSGQRKLMFNGSGRHERVVHRAACNSNSGQSIQQISCRLCAEKARLRKVAAEKVEDGAWCTTNRRGQASKDREGLKSGMS